MAPVPHISVKLQDAPIDISGEVACHESEFGSDMGAIVTFTGYCRSEEGRLSGLKLEHYPEMASAQIVRIAEEAVDRWPLIAITIIHRYGMINVGENIVLVIAVSSHRSAAFEGADFVMDFLKTSAPFWKKEIPTVGGKGKWVDANSEDDAALLRWKST